MSIRDLQLLFMGMLLAAPKRMKEEGIEPSDFADVEFAQLVSVLKHDGFGSTEKQTAIKEFIFEQFGVSVKPESWREELHGELKVNGEFGRLCSRLTELEHFDTKNKTGQLSFIKHFKHLANGFGND